MPRSARLALPVLGTFAAALLGGLGSARSAEFYAALDKPGWAPPAGLFGPVWTVLYLMIAAAGVLVALRQEEPHTRPALWLFAAQLLLNALWPWLFFEWRLGGAAFAEIVVLWVVLVRTVLEFARIRPVAAALLLPYLGWVSFAAALTWAVWRRNPGLLALAAG
jgi:benzodiazapine receptor